jgi:hypothetical protein
MQSQTTRKRALAGIIAVLLLSLAGVAAAHDHGAATALTGTVVGFNRDLNYITVRDDVTGRNFKVDIRSMQDQGSVDVWKLREGDRVSAMGDWSNKETYRADHVTMANRQALNRIANGMTGTVESVNRDLNYITVRDDVTGQPIKVDVRGMDTRRSVNVWQLRQGDTVTAHGKWTKKGERLRADFVNSSSNAPMSSGFNASNLVTGTVESIHQDLNYVTIRNDANGQPVRIDVRKMDTRRSVNVWRLRAGDRITVNGAWDGDRFQAEMVNF